jgi:hypothetical protein
VLKGSNETSSLAALLSSTADLIRGHVDDVAANGVHSGGLVGVNHCLVALPRIGDRAGSTWVQAQRKPDRGPVGCPLDPKALGLGVTGVEHSSVGFPRLP